MQLVFVGDAYPVYAEEHWNVFLLFCYTREPSSFLGFLILDTFQETKIEAEEYSAALVSG